MKEIIRTRHFWIVAVILAVNAFLHYTPQIRFLDTLVLTRHAVERILFILPAAWAAFAFGQAGGLITLAIAVLIMLPRVFLISPYPIDALVETIGIAVVGYVVIWLIEAREREKRFHQKAAEAERARNEELAAFYAINHAAAQSLDLEEALKAGLEETLKVLRVEAGGIFVIEPDEETMTLLVHQGFSDEFVEAVRRIHRGEGISGQAVAVGKPVVLDVSDYPTERLVPFIVKEGLQTLAGTPLIFRGQTLGALTLGTPRARAFSPQEVKLLAAMGQQLGAIYANVQLYDELRKAKEELEERVEKLETFQRITMDREKRIMELKREVKKLKKRLEAEERGR